MKAGTIPPYMGMIEGERILISKLHMCTRDVCIHGHELNIEYPRWFMVSNKHNIMSCKLSQQLFCTVSELITHELPFRHMIKLIKKNAECCV